MAKSQLFRAPMQWIYTHGGVFPVRRGFARRGGVHHRQRGSSSAAARSPCTARAGARARGELGEAASRGIGRLALESGATIVPVAIHGSSKVRNWKRLQFPKVTIQYGDPFLWERVEEPTRDQQQAVADEIFTAIKALYAELEAEGRAGVRAVRELRRAGARGARRPPGLAAHVLAVAARRRRSRRRRRCRGPAPQEIRSIAPPTALMRSSPSPPAIVSRVQVAEDAVVARRRRRWCRRRESPLM